jgi:hypothetical protein
VFKVSGYIFHGEWSSEGLGYLGFLWVLENYIGDVYGFKVHGFRASAVFMTMGTIYLRIYGLPDWRNPD